MRTDRLGEALALAHDLHATQRRKGSDIPYLSHLMAVSALVMENGGDEDQAIAALLHDAVEDQGGPETAEMIRARFGDRVAAIVLACTDSVAEPKPDWATRKRAYIAGIATKPADAILVTLADKVHNAQAITDDRARVGEAVWDRFTASRDEVLWYYRSLHAALAARLPGVLADRLGVLVAGLAAPAGR